MAVLLEGVIACCRMQSKPPFRDLRVLDGARALAVDVHSAAESSRRPDSAGLWVQARRSAVSISANIAEGFARRTEADRLRFLNIALASLRETQQHLRLCQDLGLIHEQPFLRIA